MYDYKCLTCGKKFEVFQHMDEKPFNIHPHDGPNNSICSGPMERQIALPSIRFVGSGFYVNDYKKNNE
jgi:putative FmdB family regulatory protein